MNTLFSYLRLILFCGGVLAGIQLPVFVDQYGKSLEAHFLESGKNLQEFQVDAQKYFDGDMDKLITYYKAYGDPVFHDGGKSIQAIYHRHLKLKSAISDFKKGSRNAYTQAFFAPVADIRKEVVKNYSYSIKLDPESIIIGLISGLLLTVLAEAATSLAIAVVVLFKKRLQPAP